MLCRSRSNARLLAIAGGAACIVRSCDAGALPPSVLARPIGGALPGGFAASGPIGGPLLGLEGAWAATLPANDERSHGSWAFGARAGWAFANGLAVHLRYDDLGVEPASPILLLQFATAGLRYNSLRSK